ncbi:beta-ketoacyl-[acyl-carrier-protein] synthase family protein [Apibacter raozihei]|uniref:beta-ketoacyl-[acyl-carrier-protein] synthase family protein n=1 Tax=Apibacter raozihei TaxID=2500547 RepID=UPI000FE35E91|nr:beta-ketoacyl-[acyl-carrier-protein] synthase family protein [Apibacter raozihei]
MQPIKKIAITGAGIISAIGNNVQENYNALINEKSGIGDIQFLETYYQGKLLAGEVKYTNEQLYSLLGLQPEKPFTRTSLLALMAAQEACKSANISSADQISTGLISATTVGGMDASEKYYNEYLISDEHLKYIPTHHCGYHTEQLADYLGITGFITTLSTACSSAANAIMLGARMLASGKLDRVIVGGADALSKFTLNGFNSLMIFSDELCKPFDENRKGLNLGEAAAYLVLESEFSLKKTGNVPLAYILGYGNANDAFHQTASSEDGEGAFLAMNKALETSGLKSEQVDYINVHGTATPNNDLTEGKAILRIFGGKEKVPPFSSTKAFTGHTLAAAGAIEAVFSVLALQNQIIYPNLNFENKIKELDIIPCLKLQSAKLQHILSNSLGFGGNCTSLLISGH